MLRNTVLTIIGKVGFARHLRKNQTPGEKVLWGKLQRRQFHGYKFRRQVPVGPYVVDFLCVEKKLIIEIDGDSHYEPGAQKRDDERESYLRKRGLTVVRFGNRQMVTETEAVLRRIAECLGIYFE